MSTLEASIPDIHAEARERWQEIVRRKAVQIQTDWVSQSKGRVSLQDALVGVYAAHSARGIIEIPRVLIKDSEGATDGGLMRVFDRILGVMRTPTYHTVNYTHQKEVASAEGLCARYSVTMGDHLYADAHNGLYELVGRHTIYFDRARDLSLYGDEILRDLNTQFGHERIAHALPRHEAFSRMLGESRRIASEDDHHHSLMRDAGRRIESGLADLVDFMPEEARSWGIFKSGLRSGTSAFVYFFSGDDDEDSRVFNAVSGFVGMKDKEKRSYNYSDAQYALRGIPPKGDYVKDACSF